MCLQLGWLTHRSTKVASHQMDLTEIESKLHALEKLYGLLVRNYDDTCHLSSAKLDDGARYLLKNLLDMETERVIKAHSEIAESKRVDESYSSQQLIDSIMNTRIRAGEVPSQALIGDREDLTTDLIFSLGKEQNVCDPPSPPTEVNQSNMASTASASANREKRCRICQRKQSKPSSNFSDRGGAQTPNEVNVLHSASFIIENEEHKKRGSDDDTSVPFVVLSGSSKKNSSSQEGQYDLSSSGISEFLPSNNAAQESVNIKGTNSFSKEDADFVSTEPSAAVGKIQSHTMALKLDAESCLPPRKRAAQFGLMASVTDSRLPSMPMKGGEPVADITSSQARKKLTNSPSLLVNQVAKPQLPTQIESEQKIGDNSGQTERKQQTLQKIVPSLAVRTPSNTFESLCNQIIPVNRLPSRNRRGRGLREHEAKKSNWRPIPSARLISQMNKEDRDNQMHRNNEGTRQTVVDHTSHTIHPSQKTSRRRHFPLESPNFSLAEDEPSQPSDLSLHDHSLDRHQDRFLKNKNKIRRRIRKERMDQREIESTDSDYSPPTNQLSSDSSNEIDLNSASAEIYSSGTPSSRSESDDVYSLPRRTRHLPASSTSSSETEVHSSACRSDFEIYSSTSSSGSRQDTGTSSNERHKYPSYAQSRPGTKHNQELSYSSDDSASSRESGGGVHTKSSREREKRAGLKKLKDKLAIVFHHHHNHHHHLHGTDKKDHNHPAAKKNPGKSLWKRSKKVKDLEREKEIKGEHAAEKLGNSIVRGGTKKNQHGHFYELMKGLLRHKRHAKLSKRSQPHHKTKKAPKTSQWWKLLRNHQGSKVHKKAHTKIK